MTPQKASPSFVKATLPTGMDIALVSPDGCFLTVQQLVPDLAVVGLGGGGLQAVDDAAVGIYAHMGFHPEVPVKDLCVEA